MRVLVQRVKNASVTVNQKIISEIHKGFLLLVGIKETDNLQIVEKVAKKIAGLRIFDDADGKMNLSLSQVNGEILSVSQFTLFGDVRKGYRPSFIEAAKPEHAKDLYNKFNECLRSYNLICKEGIFQEEMLVNLSNDGPITIIVDSDDM